MTSSVPTTDAATIGVDAADRDLKAAHQRLWSLGDYPNVATVVIPDLGRTLVAAAGVSAGQDVLDVAAGSGNAAIPAAEAGARVVAADLCPPLLSAGEAEAQRRGLRVSWQHADAEALPYPDRSFDVVLSSVGVMFAPHHRRVADELTRVTRAGGTIALTCWTPGGFVGRMFQVMKPYGAPPPEGTQPPLLWGEPEHVRELFGDRVDLTFATDEVRVDAFADGAAFRRLFSTQYGPTVGVYQRLSGDPDRRARLDAELDRLYDDAREPDGSTRWEYLLITGRRVN